MGLLDAGLRPAATSRRYSREHKEQAVPMVLALRAELGASASSPLPRRWAPAVAAVAVGAP